MLNLEDLEGSSHISSLQAYYLPEASNYNLEHSPSGQLVFGSKTEYELDHDTEVQPLNHNICQPLLTGNFVICINTYQTSYVQGC